MNGTACPFTGAACDGGEVHGGTVGCGYKDGPGAECSWSGDVPKWVSPRDFYNAAVMEVMKG